MSVDVLNPEITGRLLPRANPLSKLFAATLVTIVVMLSVDWVSAGVVLVCELLLLPLLGISVRRLLVRTWPFVLAAVVGAYGTALLAEKTGRVVLEAGPVLFTEDSVNAGLAIGLRALAIALPGLFLLSSTDPTDLADALAQRLRAPHRFVLGALAGMRLVGLLFEEWRTLGLARHARGVGHEGNPAARLGNFLGQAFGLMVQAIRRATRLAVAMEARGFGAGKRTWARESTFSRVDIGVALGGVVIAALAVTLAVLAGTWNFVLG
ncbi:energy-coupling factor transporter transmembrane protein EcfT [Arthrobacter sp. JZ12]|uniref:energy-coupling factor transporter transmembrane component T family protein n=1 Tax=Arthrobacter sp. JZ12 TaxID=2654190 RepID=UPI002B49CC51|nr:energy-coupling factor transporter transmembrane component T [Arthrobacter sp. JZ12]WRH25882.1 energy-coupling factor transporter transmembrane protein EcfT [Arthrobacter sp. JZ12]